MEEAKGYCAGDTEAADVAVCERADFVCYAPDVAATTAVLASCLALCQPSATRVAHAAAAVESDTYDHMRGAALKPVATGTAGLDEDRLGVQYLCVRALCDPLRPTHLVAHAALIAADAPDSPEAASGPADIWEDAPCAQHCATAHMPRAVCLTSHSTLCAGVRSQCWNIVHGK
jgi:hypothetical protein